MDSAEEAAQLLAGEEEPTGAKNRGWKRLAVGVSLMGMAALLCVTTARALSPGAPRFVTLFDDSVCWAEGTWNDGQGLVDFAVTDNNVSLAVAGQPRLRLAVGPKGVERFEVGHESVDMAGAFSEEAQTGIRKVSRALGPSARGLSKYLAAQGWNGADRPCAYKLHMLLLFLAPEHEDRELMKEPHTGPYGHEDLCPAKRKADWKCHIVKKVWFKETIGKWLKPGDELLAEPKTKLFENDVCEGTKKNPKCRGLCGKGCDCWESICGSHYLCDYNPVCCGHDVECTGNWLRPGCLNVLAANFACSNAGVDVYGPDAP